MTRTDPAMGVLIADTGRARDTGHLTHDQAVAAVLAADPGMTRQGAAMQLSAWRSAITRYAPTARVEGRPVNARALSRREPIRIRFPRTTA